MRSKTVIMTALAALALLLGCTDVNEKYKDVPGFNAPDHQPGTSATLQRNQMDTHTLLINMTWDPTNGTSTMRYKQ